MHDDLPTAERGMHSCGSDAGLIGFFSSLAHPALLALLR